MLWRIGSSEEAQLLTDVACYRLRGTILAESPLHIGSGRRAGVIKRCLRYIPGSFLRGSAGVSLLKASCKRDSPLKNHEECEFWDDCLYASLMEEAQGKQSKIFFRYSYPLHLRCSSGVYEPVPLTLHECGNPQCKEVYDTFVPPPSCEKCSSPIRPVRGFRCRECGTLEQRPINLSRIVLTAVDRSVQSAASVKAEAGGEQFGTLHALEVIDKGSTFGLDIIVDRDCEQSLSTLLSVVQSGVLDEGLGGSKSRGLGKVRVEAGVETVSVDALKSRADSIDSRDFRVRLVSPMVLERDQVLEPKTLLEGVRRAYSWAYGAGKPSLPEVSLVERRLDWEYVGGWSLRDDRERRRDVALSAGSVFRYRSVGSQELAEGLAALEMFSIGSLKPYGCGQVKVEVTN